MRRPIFTCIKPLYRLLGRTRLDWRQGGEGVLRAAGHVRGQVRLPARERVPFAVGARHAAALGSGRYAPPTHENAEPSLTVLSDDIPENIP